MCQYGEHHPDTIRAKAEGKVRVIEARARLHPVAQVIISLLEGIRNIAVGVIGRIGCLGFIIVALSAVLVPKFFQAILSLF